MSVGLGIQWANGEYECGNSIGQSGAARIADWAESQGLPLLSQIRFNGWPQFTPATLDQLIAEFERLREWCADEFPDKANDADVFLPRLRELREQTGWTEGDFG